MLKVTINIIFTNKKELGVSRYIKLITLLIIINSVKICTHAL